MMKIISHLFIVVIISIVLAGTFFYNLKFKPLLKYEESSCVLKGFGNACIIYMNENDKLPHKLQTVLDLDNFQEPVCPICKRKYKYYGNGISYKMGSELIIALDDCESDKRGYQITLSDAREKYYIKPDEMLKYLETDRKLRIEYNLDPIPLEEIRYNSKMSLADYAKQIENTIK